MTTGEGIFCGFALLALVWLFSVTKDRWRWKRIVLWCVGLIVAPVLAIGAWFAVNNYLDEQPRFASEYWGLRVGMPIAEVIYLKGQPKYKDDAFIAYPDVTPGVVYVVRLRNSMVRAIHAMSSEGSSGSNFVAIQGISHYSTQARIENKFGKPDVVSVSKDNAQRMLTYLRFGIFFELEKDQVRSLGVLDPKEGALTYAD